MKVDGDLLKQRIGGAGLTQTDFAKKLGVRITVVQGWIKRGSIPPKWIEDVENILGDMKQNSETALFEPIPYYGISDNRFQIDDEGMPEPEPDSAYVIPGLDADLVLQCHENWLAPQIEKGDKIFCKKMDKDDVINYGYAYLIQTETINMIRYVKQSEKEGHILLHSLKEGMDDFDYPLDKIRNMYWIIKVLK